MPKALHTECKTCFGGPRMILYGFRKKHFLKNTRVFFSLLTPPSPAPSMSNATDFTFFFFSFLNVFPSDTQTWCDVCDTFYIFKKLSGFTKMCCPDL